MEIAIIILLAVNLVLLVMLYQRKPIDKTNEVVQKISELGQKNDILQSQLRQEVSRNIESQIKLLSDLLMQIQSRANDQQSSSLQALEKTVNQKLSEIQKTVNEKLESTLNERLTNSFKQVSSQLENVHKSLGQMQALAASVGDLKKVLANVKNRGNLGEVQLENILQDILAPELYCSQFEIKPGSRRYVDFAVKMPGDKDSVVYLPIDAKFPGDSYAALQEAYDSGSKDDIINAGKALEAAIMQEAKSISEKYIVLPYTTNFAVMFLPFEGLYAEIARRNLIEKLQQQYRVTVAGPSTMAAMLCSLQMGFRTLQIQKNGQEVWTILSAVKTEFGNFEIVFNKAQEKIRQLDSELDKLIGVRTRAIIKKLNSVQKLDMVQTEEVLSIGSEE